MVLSMMKTRWKQFSNTIRDYMFGLFFLRHCDDAVAHVRLCSMEKRNLSILFNIWCSVSLFLTNELNFDGVVFSLVWLISLVDFCAQSFNAHSVLCAFCFVVLRSLINVESFVSGLLAKFLNGFLLWICNLHEWILLWWCDLAIRTHFKRKG